MKYQGVFLKQAVDYLKFIYDTKLFRARLNFFCFGHLSML